MKAVQGMVFADAVLHERKFGGTHIASTRSAVACTKFPYLRPLNLCSGSSSIRQLCSVLYFLVRFMI